LAVADCGKDGARPRNRENDKESRPIFFLQIVLRKIEFLWILPRKWLIAGLTYQATTEQHSEHISGLKKLREKLVKDLDDYCKDLAALVDTKLLVAADSNTKVFYQKLKADY
jgi:hypothetical protein